MKKEKLGKVYLFVTWNEYISFLHVVFIGNAVQLHFSYYLIINCKAAPKFYFLTGKYPIKTSCKDSGNENNFWILWESISPTKHSGY